MRDVWKAALEWYIYYRDVERKPKLAIVVMAIKDQLQEVATIGDLGRHYAGDHRLRTAAVAELYPRDWWLDTQQIEDVAYGLRCMELATGKRIDLRRWMPSRWLVELVA
jgi:hypothetical protein